MGGCGYGVAAHDIEIAGERACEVDSHFVYLCVCFLHHYWDPLSEGLDLRG